MTCMLGWRERDRYMKDVQQVRVIEDRYRDVQQELRCTRAVREVRCVSRKDRGAKR